MLLEHGDINAYSSATIKYPYACVCVCLYEINTIFLVL